MKIKRIPVPTCNAYYGDLHLGKINEYEFAELRVRVADENITGVKCRFQIGDEVSVCELNPDGTISGYRDGMFDQLYQSTCKLLEIL